MENREFRIFAVQILELKTLTIENLDFESLKHFPWKGSKFVVDLHSLYCPNT